jgi:hypothetical protein
VAPPDFRGYARFESNEWRRDTAVIRRNQIKPIRVPDPQHRVPTLIVETGALFPCGNAQGRCLALKNMPTDDHIGSVLGIERDLKSRGELRKECSNLALHFPVPLTLAGGQSAR